MGYLLDCIDCWTNMNHITSNNDIHLMKSISYLVYECNCISFKYMRLIRRYWNGHGVTYGQYMITFLGLRPVVLSISKVRTRRKRFVSEARRTMVIIVESCAHRRRRVVVKNTNVIRRCNY